MMIGESELGTDLAVVTKSMREPHLIGALDLFDHSDQAPPGILWDFAYASIEFSHLLSS